MSTKLGENLGEIIVSAVLVLLVLLKLDPFGWTMPTQVQMLVLVFVIAAFGLYAGLLFREKARDEREAYHRYKASRGAYVGGIALIVLAIVVQSLRGGLDPWLVGILAGMVIIKMIILIRSRFRN